MAPSTMRAVGYAASLPLSDAAALENIELPVPTPGAGQLLVRVRAVAMNPADVKIRMWIAPEAGQHRVLGLDAAGEVVLVGDGVTGFAPGDQVVYLHGSFDRGTNAEYHLTDAVRAVHKPASLSFGDAAALPVAGLTSWELLFDVFRVTEGAGEGDTLLVINGAGGVGSMLIQLAKTLTKLRVVATASRPETEAWCTKLGADAVVNHHKDIKAQLAGLGIPAPRYVASLAGTERNWASLVDLIAPRGHIALIDDPETLDVKLLKTKSLTVTWELCLTRPLCATPDVAAHAKALARIADLAATGQLQAMATTRLSPIDATTIAEAQALQESGKCIGKTVIEGWSE